jgi:hypothetical protein
MTDDARFDRIAGYRFVRLLGSGSFAHTYLAQRDGEQFAVKVFHDLPASGYDQERFRREVLSLRISHANLAEYVQSGVDTFGGRPVAFIAMRYVAGASLRERLLEHGGKLPWQQAVAIARDVAAGLSCLHEHGIAHRDLKPANIYLPRAGGAIILDFGLAAVQELATITSRGAFVGTRAYCAPEQIRGEADVHSDLYALGAVLFEALTGQRPFPASNELELIDRIRYEDPEPPAALEPSVPRWLDDLILNLLAKEPLLRPRGANAVLDALRDLAHHRVPAISEPYDRHAAPLLVTCVTTRSASRAVVDLALHGIGPDIAVAAITQPTVLDDLHHAAGLAGTSLAVDTRVLDTATGGYRGVAALRDRAFLPAGAGPHTPGSLRSSAEVDRVARGDIREQIDQGAGVLRATAFTIDSLESGWLRRNPRLLEASLDAREAFGFSGAMYARVPCTIDALTHHNDRLTIVNRFARGEPDGYWVAVAGLEVSGADQITGALDFVLMLQQLGAPCLWTLPGTLAELAWSLGVGGVEVPLGRAGGFRLPTSTRQTRQTDHAPRFEFRSVMTSLSAQDAAQALKEGVFAESDCDCPSCRRASSIEERLAFADEHNLWTWVCLRSDLAGLDADARVERYQMRLPRAAEQLKAARRSLPALRSLRHIALAQQTLDVVLREGILDTPRRLRRSA